MPSFEDSPGTLSEVQDGPLPHARCDPEDIHLYTSPWVQGTRASAYYGPVSSTGICDNGDWESTIKSTLAAVRTTTSVLGGNSIVGIELCFDPFALPPSLNIVGTAAFLEPLF